MPDDAILRLTAVPANRHRAVGMHGQGRMATVCPAEPVKPERRARPGGGGG